MHGSLPPESFPADLSKGEVGRAGSWPVQFSWLRSPPIWFSAPASVFLFLVGIALLCLSAVAMIWLGIDLLSGDASRAREATKSLLPIAAAAIGLPLIVWRLVILSRQTATAEHKTQIDRETHYTSIFSKSVEQLGATREVKQVQLHDNKFESVNKTAPNIEVRLGGIHSIVRLAEESKRDAKKIENMLLSYVRENSWYDRDGGRAATHGRWMPSSYTSWSYAFQQSAVDVEKNEELKAFHKKDDELHKHLGAWGAHLSETRVDVAEALEALSPISAQRDTPEMLSLEESLFVRRIFAANRFNAYYFSRSTFVRCRFISGDSCKLIYRNCWFIDCIFEGNKLCSEFFRAILLGRVLIVLTPGRLI